MSVLPIERSHLIPKISIGLVVYNGEAHLKNVLDSIAGQSYKNIELIVVDGDSTDGTMKILREYEKHISVLVSEPDQGIYDAMNKVCARATGDWLLFLGCDDVLCGELGVLVQRMTLPESVYYGDVILSSSSEVYGGFFSKFRLMQHNICHQAIFYPRSVYSQYTYSLKYKFLADHAYNIRLMGEGVVFVYLNAIVSIFNNKGGSFQGDLVFYKDQIKLISASFGNVYALLEIIRRQAQKFLDGLVRLIGYVAKRFLPSTFWEYFQSLWRRVRKKM